MDIVHLFYPVDAGMKEIPDTGQVLAIGDFDGVHLGHRSVLAEAARIAADKRLPLAVMTFNPHPREVLGMEGYARYLAPIHDRMRLFEELGVDLAYVTAFDRAFARVSPEHFIDRMLVPLRIDTVVVGFDFTFGHRGSGTTDTLARLCEGRIGVSVVPPFYLDGQKVSSTLIRDALAAGEMDKVMRYLGRPYRISGWVVQGDQRGRSIGFPTANLDLTAPYVIPANGVYAVRVSVDGVRREGVMNIGYKPTFQRESVEPTLEVHLLDFSGDLYGRTMKVDLIGYLRPERRFASVEELTAQIRRDIDAARHLLSSV